LYITTELIVTYSIIQKENLAWWLGAMLFIEVKPLIEQQAYIISKPYDGNLYNNMVYYNYLWFGVFIVNIRQPKKYTCAIILQTNIFKFNLKLNLTFYNIGNLFVYHMDADSTVIPYIRRWRRWILLTANKWLIII